MSSTDSAVARAAPRLTAVVVLPTPPFWLAMAIVLGIDAGAVRPALLDLTELRNAGHAPLLDDEGRHAVGPVGGLPPVATALVEVPDVGRREDVAGAGRIHL